MIVTLAGAACVPEFEERACWTLDCPAPGAPNAAGFDDASIDGGVADLGVADLGPALVDPCLDESSNGASWVVRNVSLAPAPRDRASFTYSPLNRELILIGGVIFPGVVQNDVWSWTGTRWRQRPTSNFEAHADHATAQDRFGRLLTFGGRESYDALPHDETWIWTGTDMDRLFVQPSPPARVFAKMVYDSARERTVLFGGFDAAMNALDDTWEWDGETWNEAGPATSPPGLASPAMAYDSARRRVVLYGGTADPGIITNELWTYDGTTWTELVSPSKPSPRGAAQLFYDPLRAVLVMYGGTFAANSNYRETWELDGELWRNISVPPELDNCSNSATAFDAAGGYALSFSGWDGGGHSPRTWQYCPR